MKQRTLKKAIKQLMKHSIYSDGFALYDENGTTQHWSTCWYELKQMNGFPKQGSKRRKACLYALSNLVNFGPGLSRVGQSMI